MVEESIGKRISKRRMSLRIKKNVGTGREV